MTAWVMTVKRPDGIYEMGVAATAELAKRALINAANALESSELQLTSFISDIEEDYTAGLPYMGIPRMLFAEEFEVIETEEDTLYE